MKQSKSAYKSLHRIFQCSICLIYAYKYRHIRERVGNSRTFYIKKSEVIISGWWEYWKLVGIFASYSDTHRFDQFIPFSSFFWNRIPPSSGKPVSCISSKTCLDSTSRGHWLTKLTNQSTSFVATGIGSRMYM